MIWLRSTLYAFGMVVVTPLFSLIALLIFPLPPITRYRIISGWARSMLVWLRLTCGLKYRILGTENIPQTPVVILSKHQSAWETLAFQAIFPPVCWVMKRELLRIPFFGWGLAMTSPVAIDRAAGREALKQLIEQGKQRLLQGFNVVVFPEGTRVKPGTKGRYNVGGASLAVHADAPVVPVAHNAGEFWKKNSFLKRPGTITVSIGPAIPSVGKKSSKLSQEVENWIEAEMQRIAEQY
jgi:1-acyl-sn-glycerol-3-phosphate acyltransferase